MSPKDVVRAFHAAGGARDVEALCALYAEDAVTATGTSWSFLRMHNLPLSSVTS
jgi:ketosteroid isomerase-like protein